MRITQRIKYAGLVQPEFVNRQYPIHYLEPGDQVRVGFEKGTLDRATFELSNGNVIIYERNQEATLAETDGIRGIWGTYTDSELQQIAKEMNTLN